jgi:Zinc knuckle
VPASTATKYEEQEWSGLMKVYQQRVANLEDGMRRLYNVVYRQCSPAMIQKLTAIEGFTEDIVQKSDALELLMAIKGICFNFQSLKFGPHAIHDAIKQFCAFSQGQNMTCAAYLKEFNNNVDVVSYCGGTIGMSPALFLGLATEINFNQATATDAERLRVSAAARERYLATAFIMGADRRRFGGLLRDIENSYLRNTDIYPKTMTAAFNLLANWKEEASRTHRVVSDGVAFTNDGVTLATPGRPWRDIATVECHNCGVMGHYSSDCPTPRRQTGDQMLMAGLESGEFDKQQDGTYSGFNFLNDADEDRQHGIALNVDQRGRIPKTWILLDNQSTVDVFHNKELLQRIRVSEDGHMDIHCNAGVTSTNLVGTCLGTVQSGTTHKE